LAVRDGEIGRVAAELAELGVVRARRASVVHCAGGVSAEVLSPLRSERVAVGRMHPLVAVADRSPRLEGAYAHVSGDARAVRAATAAARKLGMRPVTVPLDLTRYHAAAALLANGAAAIGGAAVSVMGAEPGMAAKMLAPLLMSVADNLARLGVPDALTGPVRRGDLEAVRRHLDALDPDGARLYRALASAQLAMARVLAEAEPEKFEAIAREIREN
jgi:predicted short-subunit dehydrogenase-like oxidoreductase (DUF2520 family)